MITRRAALLLPMVAPRAAAAQSRMCVFGIGGSINALGTGQQAKATKVQPLVLAFDPRERKMVFANDPLPGSLSGSPWPAFGFTFHDRTKLPVLFVQCAKGEFQSAKSRQVAKSGQHWDVGSPLVSLMFLAIDDALRIARQAGYDAKLCGILWCQGEYDGNGIAHGGVTQADYKAALATMIRRFRGYYGPALPFYIFRTGVPDPKIAASLVPGYAQISDAQEDVARTTPHVIIASRLAAQFAERGMLTGPVTYSQEANNELGRDGALTVIASKLWNVW